MSGGALPAELVHALTVYQDAQTDPGIMRVLARQEDPGAGHLFMADMLTSRYGIPEHRMVPLMREVAPVLGEMAANAGLETDVDFIQTRRQWSWNEWGRVDVVTAQTPGWLVWGRRGTPEQRHWMSYDPWLLIRASGVALVGQGELRQFVTDPVAAGQRITVTTERDGRPTTEAGPLTQRPENTLVDGTRPVIFHGLVVLASKIIEKT